MQGKGHAVRACGALSLFVSLSHTYQHHHHHHHCLCYPTASETGEGPPAHRLDSGMCGCEREGPAVLTREEQERQGPSGGGGRLLQSPCCSGSGARPQHLVLLPLSSDKAWEGGAGGLVVLFVTVDSAPGGKQLL